MTATYLGGLSLSAAIPGLQESLDAVGQALQALRALLQAKSSLMQSGIDAVSSALGELEGAKDALVGGPIEAANAKVDAAQGLATELGEVLDATAYMNLAIAKINEGITFIQTLLPANYLAQQIAGVNAGIDGLQGEANALLGTAEQMTDVTAHAAGPLGDLQTIKGDIDQALDDSIGGVIAYIEQLSQFQAGGIHAFWYLGALSDMGSELGAALPDTGLSGGTVIAGPVLVVDTGNTAGLAALEDVFGA